MRTTMNKQNNNTFAQMTSFAVGVAKKTVPVISFLAVCTYGAMAQAAVIATFDVTTDLIGLPPSSVSESASSIGTALLDDTGILKIVETTDHSLIVPLSDAAHYQAVSETTFSGSLTGSTFSSVNITSRQLLDCTDTGSIGAFAPDACIFVEPLANFLVLTQPIEFDLALSGVTQFDWDFSFAGQGLPDSANGFLRVNLTTTSVSSVPVPPAFLLFLSGMFTLLAPKLTRLKNKAL